jgi:cysteinyl-tRNA synthetase
LNFTFDGLKSAASSVEKLRNFRFRLTSAQLQDGVNPAMAQLASETEQRIKGALEDDLNTAQAQAAVFDMARKANAALETGGVRKEDVQRLLAALDKFDEVFGVLKDDDQPKMRAVLDWARTAGRENEASPELLEIAGSSQLSDEQVNQKIVEMEGARKARNFKASDALRAELVAAGIVVENTKDGVRWRRK